MHVIYCIFQLDDLSSIHGIVQAVTDISTKASKVSIISVCVIKMAFNQFIHVGHCQLYSQT